MKFPYTINKFSGKDLNSILKSNKTLCININQGKDSELECELNTELEVVGNQIQVNSLYHKIYIRTKTNSLDSIIRKLRTTFREKFTEINENLFFDENLYIELCLCPKTRDTNGVVVEKLYNSMFILVYSEYRKQNITINEYKSINISDIEIQKDIDIKVFLEEYFDIEKTLTKQLEALKNFT